MAPVSTEALMDTKLVSAPLATGATAQTVKMLDVEMVRLRAIVDAIGWNESDPALKAKRERANELIRGLRDAQQALAVICVTER